MMTGALSPLAVAEYEHDGYLCPLPVMSEVEAADCLRRYLAFDGVGGKTAGEVYRHRPHLFFTWLDSIMRSPAILDPVESLLGPDILCWSTGFFAKRVPSTVLVEHFSR